MQGPEHDLPPREKGGEHGVDDVIIGVHARHSRGSVRSQQDLNAVSVDVVITHGTFSFYTSLHQLSFTPTSSHNRTFYFTSSHYPPSHYITLSHYPHPHDRNTLLTARIIIRYVTICPTSHTFPHTKTVPARY